MQSRLMRGLSGAVFALLLTAGCGDDGTGGAAGDPGPSSIGGACSNTCASGLICSSGLLSGTCTAGCSAPGAGNPGCGVIESRAICIGANNSECALPCVDDDDCGAGTVCEERESTMVCVAN